MPTAARVRSSPASASTGVRANRASDAGRHCSGASSANAPPHTAPRARRSKALPRPGTGYTQEFPSLGEEIGSPRSTGMLMLPVCACSGAVFVFSMEIGIYRVVVVGGGVGWGSTRSIGGKPLRLGHLCDAIETANMSGAVGCARRVAGVVRPEADVVEVAENRRAPSSATERQNTIYPQRRTATRCRKHSVFDRCIWGLLLSPESLIPAQSRWTGGSRSSSARISEAKAGSFLRRSSVIRTACITVVWSRPPK